MAMVNMSRGLLRIAEAERLMCVNNGIANGKWQTGHTASSAKRIAEAEHLMCSGRKRRRMAMADRSRGLLRKVSCESGTPHVVSRRKCRRMGMAENKVGMTGELAGRLYALAFDVYVSSILLEY